MRWTAGQSSNRIGSMVSAGTGSSVIDIGLPRRRHRTDPVATCRVGWSRRPWHDRSPKRAEPLDSQNHLVAGLEVAAERRVADFEQASRPDGPAADEVARAD